MSALNRQRQFDAFRDEYIRQSAKTYTSYRELAADPPEADAYIAGSDQVWNPDFLGVANTDGPLRAFMLDFGSAAAGRIAYAASFGKERDAVIQKMARNDDYGHAVYVYASGKKRNTTAGETVTLDSAKVRQGRADGFLRGALMLFFSLPAAAQTRNC